MDWRLIPGWLPDGGGLLPALRTCYAYTERQPDRATGYLWSAGRELSQPPTPWPDALTAYGPRLLDDLEAATGTRFTVACFQAYLDGSGCGWHHDRDWDAQAILSLGVTRSFGLRRAGHATFFPVCHGDLLFMPPGFQAEWEHCVPQEQARGERCSLVFRTSVPKE